MQTLFYCIVTVYCILFVSAALDLRMPLVPLPKTYKPYGRTILFTGYLLLPDHLILELVAGRLNRYDVHAFCKCGYIDS